MLPDFVDLDSSQAQAIERSYRSSLKRELVKRGIQVVDEGFSEQRRDGKKPAGFTKVTDLELARSLGAAAVCYATVESIEVEQKSGAKRFSIRASWSLVRATDGFSVAAGDGAAALIEEEITRLLQKQPQLSLACLVRFVNNWLGVGLRLC